MENFTITIGTSSEQKIKYLKNVLRELKIKAELIPFEAKSGVSDQPRSARETKQGSINRAKEAFKKAKEADFSIGIEVGYYKNRKKEYEMFCWVTIIGQDGCQVSSQSHRFLLPKYHQKILNKGIYLGDNLNGYTADRKPKNHIKKQIDNMIRYRKPFIENALENALIHYLDREDF